MTEEQTENEYLGLTLGELIENRARAKEASAAANKEADRCKADLALVDAAIIAMADSQGTRTLGNEDFNLSINSETVPTNIDWDALGEFIIENSAMHLVQRRINTKPWREHQQVYGEYPPGASETLEVKKVSMRKRPKR